MIVLFLVTLCTALTSVAVVSLYRITSARRRRIVPRHGMPPVTVLKPLCGADDDLESNLETFFAQTYPGMELLFGVQGDQDASIPVVRRLMERYPDVPARLVIHDGGRAINPKISNLRAMLEAGTHDLILISDSNVAAPRDYVRSMVSQRVCGERVGLVTSVIAGVGEQTVGAALDNVHLNGVCAGAVAASAEVWGRAAAIGKSMLLSRTEFQALGGFESVATLLAEDYVMGRMYHEAGYRVVLDPTVIHNVNRSASKRVFLRRQLRWGLLRSKLAPGLYWLEALGNPMAVGVIAAAIGGVAWPLAWGVLLAMVRDALCWARLRGRHGLALALPLAPLKDALLFGVWATAPLLRHITWRDNRVRVGAGTRLYTDTPLAAPQLLDEEGTRSPVEDTV